MRNVALFCLVTLAACSAKDRPAPPDEPAVPASLTMQQFQKLRWLQGTWRGGVGAQSFYESYVFLDDSTVRSFTYADSTLAQSTDSATIRWSRNGVNFTGGGMEWMVTEFDSTHVKFEPLRNATNSFTWTPRGTDAWTAVLEGRNADGSERSRTYRMVRRGS